MRTMLVCSMVTALLAQTGVADPKDCKCTLNVGTPDCPKSLKAGVGTTIKVALRLSGDCKGDLKVTGFISARDKDGNLVTSSDINDTPSAAGGVLRIQVPANLGQGAGAGGVLKIRLIVAPNDPNCPGSPVECDIDIAPA